MKQRIITAIIFGAILIPVVIYGGTPVVLLAYVLAAAALFEVLKMRRLKMLSVPGIITLALLWGLMLPDGAQEWPALQFAAGSKTEIGMLAVLLLLTYTVASKNRFTFDDAAFSILASIYVGIGFYYFIETREAGILFIFFSLFIVWATDSGAYFIGKAMGKNKLWPEISPNKTVEGFIGGVVCAVAVAVLFVLLTDIDATLLQLTFITIVLSIFGQIGDLAESALKRHYEVKDSGTILPGHGGILDRFDSLLFVWPLLHFFQLLN
ncbi:MULTISPECIES: phosphatidate cytidylyltransferase [Bacillus]|uniref:Phosphatidate cytidylyltransferase n=1 Tax=Bacillus infantis TaxID=324767 RepID=A0A5D4SLY0_9BACI|nr:MULTISPECIES: phosphatidate cytidylyltransferase [Bacillus]OXT18623.1 phosphatidate cytidylyltransferase [Bacillus sp. OG2]MCK6206233.1 phosphatidate cytidylyltransferase [Bacillus infantis]MDT0159356.1 phosphatidate cytidylyltransferase [Bacillus sp. AG4(2022)]RYI32102.1 phosphatidate cytidylyltransferase [Bacillus infantis]TYS63188.1 phosphatidate cytidylyltransferase [Bacillus infantis]